MVRTSEQSESEFLSEETEKVSPLSLPRSTPHWLFSVLSVSTTPKKEPYTLQGGPTVLYTGNLSIPYAVL